jgi:hypothetical protein
VYVFSPGCNELDLDFHRAGMDFIETSPGCFGLSGTFTGLEWTLLKLHRAVLDFLELSPGWNDIHRKYTGCYELTRRITGLFWIFVEIHRAGTYPTSSSTGLFWIK